MKRISTAVLAVALMGGATGVIVAVPALAKKEEPAKPTGPVVSKAFNDIFQKGRTALLAKDNAGALAAASEADAAAKSDDEKYYASLLRYLATSQQMESAASGTNGVTDSSALLPSLDALIANPKTPLDQRAKFEFHRGAIAYDAKQFPVAVKMFTAAQADGNTEKQLPFYLAKAKVQAGDTAGGLADLAKLADTGTQDEDVYRWAIQNSNNRGLKAETVNWLRRWMGAYPTTKVWHDALYYYGVSGGAIVKLTKRQQIDVFRLLVKTNALPDYAGYAVYGQNALDVGLPDETKAAILDGRAKGKIQAGESVTTGVLARATAQIAGEGSFAALEAKAAAAPTGAPSAQTADAYYGRGEYAKAIALYRQALTKGGINADEVNLHLGIALAVSGDKAGAKTALGLVAAAPYSEIAGFWTVWLDHPPTG